MSVSIPSAHFSTSAAHFSEMPTIAKPEFAIMGRSNVGKSSFMNHLFNQQRLAKVSGKPGKTVLANFFEVGSEAVWVDLPGYGYARASKVEKKRISTMIGEYCGRRENLRGIIWLLDIRHPGATADMETLELFGALQMPLLPILTKADKLSRNKQLVQVRTFRTTFGFTTTPVTYSIMEQPCREQFWQRYLQWCSPAAVEVS